MTSGRDLDAGLPRDGEHRSHAIGEEPKSLRDFMGLLALPALWAGSDGTAIMRRTFEAVGRIVPYDLVFTRLDYLPEGPPLTLLFDDSGEQDAERPERRWFTCACEAMDVDRATMDTDDGRPVYAFRIELGMGKPSGSVWFASTRPGFPTDTESALLRAAVSLAANGLHTARIAYDRERASRAKDEFLAMLGHELRNPLAPIVTALQLIKMRDGASFSREHVIIERQVAHLSRLVDDLLDVTRVTRGKVALRRTPTAVRGVVESAVESVSPLLEERRHALAIELGDAETVVDADPARLHQVVVNLLTNAARYTDPGGCITVSLRRCPEGVAIVVGDNGNGIDPRELPRMFELFEQAASGPDQSRSGLGIGLALVKALVELHGGSVRAHSDGIGCGSQFTVTLPAAVHAGVPAVARRLRPEPTPARRLRVLLVDDNEDALETMKAMLSARGHAVSATCDPVDALEIAPGFAPEVALLDIGMPVMDGFGLARELRKRLGEETPWLVALTGFGQPRDRARVLAAGFDEHLVKPVDCERLLTTLAAVPPR